MSIFTTYETKEGFPMIATTKPFDFSHHIPLYASIDYTHKDIPVYHYGDSRFYHLKKKRNRTRLHYNGEIVNQRNACHLCSNRVKKIYYGKCHSCEFTSRTKIAFDRRALADLLTQNGYTEIPLYYTTSTLDTVLKRKNAMHPGEFSFDYELIEKNKTIDEENPDIAEKKITESICKTCIYHNDRKERCSHNLYKRACRGEYKFKDRKSITTYEPDEKLNDYTHLIGQKFKHKDASFIVFGVHGQDSLLVSEIKPTFDMLTFVSTNVYRIDAKPFKKNRSFHSKKVNKIIHYLSAFLNNSLDYTLSVMKHSKAKYITELKATEEGVTLIFDNQEHVFFESAHDIYLTFRDGYNFGKVEKLNIEDNITLLKSSL